MLLDNETKARSAGQWLAEWTKNGKLEVMGSGFQDVNLVSGLVILEA